MNERLILSEKYKAFLRCRAPYEFLEGTTAAGKTTVGLFKFMLRVAESPKKIHILSGLDLGTIEKNIINKDLGILDDFGPLVEYNASGRGQNSLPHLLFHAPSEDKIVYVLGYDNKARWKKALGGQYGCLYIDEINIADMEFVREASMRCDYLLATLNPDNPDLPIYSEYINHARPLPEWENETPKEILSMLNEKPKPGWVHWFFSFEHNLGLPAEKVQQIRDSVPKGTKLYKNKIQGLRGRATGLVFNLQPHNLVSAKWLLEQMQSNQIKFLQVSAGVDTSYSQQSADTFAFVFSGITTDRRKITLATEVHNNRGLTTPLAPSDIPPLLITFLEKYRTIFDLFARSVFIDSADEATIIECQKYKRLHGSVYEFCPAWKKTKIIDRINLQSGWLASGDYLLVTEYCRAEIDELNAYSWKEDKDNEPEDGNDHTINADQYSWLPYKGRIGGKVMVT
ncbi:terminase [Anaeromassilibacillus senegalensis]|uniref:terminase n=1 Tax=Anaeromassilibacillus senegalensis TaxID=1673717 RepID=UPI0006822C99|nr:terminase [Anaeromassilibacillus senegalensis]